MTVPIPFASQAYALDAVQFAAQRCVNLIPERGPAGAKVPIALLGTPGLTTYATVGSGPIRGMIEMSGFVFVVSGNTLFKLEVNGDTTNLGSIPGRGLVKMASNGDQVLILAGTSPQDGFIATVDELLPITDQDFLGGSDCDFIDGYFVISVADSNEFYISALYNGFEYDPLDFARAEGKPDNIVGLVVDHREIWLYCEESTEVWYNSGNPDFPFERASGTFIERGIAGRDSIGQVDNTVFWVGDDRIVYRANGYAPVRVSTHAIEEQINEAIGTSDLVAFGYSQKGHAQYVLKKPNQWTFVYDVATELWHERCSCDRQDYKISTYVAAFNRLLVGDDTTNNIYFLDLENPGSEDDGTVVSRVAAPPLFANEETASLNALVIDFEMGVGNERLESENPIRIAFEPGVGYVRDASGINVSSLSISNFVIPENAVDTTLLVAVATEQATPGALVSRITFGTQDLTEVETAQIDTGTVNYLTVYKLDNPSGTQDIDISLDRTSSLAIAHALIVENYDSDVAAVTNEAALSAVTSISVATTPASKPGLILSFTSMGEAGTATPSGQTEIADTSRGSMSQQVGFSKAPTVAQQTLGWTRDSGSWSRAVQINVALTAAPQITRAPQVMLRYSNDAGFTWSSEKWRSLGRKGKYENRARWNRLGEFRQRVLEISITDPVERVVMGAYAELERGSL